MKARAAVAALLVFALPSAAPAAIHVSAAIDTKAAGVRIVPEIYGQFAEQLGEGITNGIWVGEDLPIPNIHGYRRDVVEALKALHVPVLRWPGGCYADHYHWRDGIGPRAQRPARSIDWWGNNEEHNAFGTHEFFDFAELIGARTYLGGNVGTGPPEKRGLGRICHSVKRPRWPSCGTRTGASSRAHRLCRRRQRELGLRRQSDGGAICAADATVRHLRTPGPGTEDRVGRAIGGRLRLDRRDHEIARQVRCPVAALLHAPDRRLGAQGRCDRLQPRPNGWRPSRKPAGSTR